MFKNLIKILFVPLFISLSACAYEKVDQRSRPDGAKAKARKNIEERTFAAKPRKF